MQLAQDSSTTRDHLGCPELVLDDAGRTAWRTTILPYGRATVDVGKDFHQPLRWPGHYFDRETGLHENRFRSYSPELGRYLQSDPAGLGGGLNLYAYTDNPVRAVDLDGLTKECPDDVEDCPHRAKEGPDQEGAEVDAKTEIDALAAKVAAQHDGTVAKAPLKSRERAREKIINDYGGDPSRIKDIARNTIVVPRGQEKEALATLMRENPNIRADQVKIVEPGANPMGYSGINATVPTQSGVPGEIQINSPEMIYAKEPAETSRAILGDEKFNELQSRTDLPPGGKGHEMYEEYRSLPEDSPRASEIESASSEYYDAFRR